MNRRDFLAATAAAAGAATSLPDPRVQHKVANAPFRLKYAPHLGMFGAHGNNDPIAELEFMAEQGFRAFEDNGMAGRPVELQEKIGKALERLGMTMGVFVGHAEWRGQSFASDDPAQTDRVIADLKNAVEVAKRVNAKWCTVVPGLYSQRIEPDYQTARAIENLKRAAAVCEPAGLVMVLEALNPWRDHPGLFLSKIPHAYLLCRAVGSPSCKILFDIYHQQITEGNLIPNIDRAWDEIAYFQAGDNPGRNEPTTGEINYKNVFRHLHRKGFQGVIGMEHGNSKPGKEGELAVVAAYRECDTF